MSYKFVVGAVSVGICIYILLLPDQRTPENFRQLFSERGLELVSITAASGGCYRVGAYNYEARLQSGQVERGHLCINKSLRVFSMTPERG